MCSPDELLVKCAKSMEGGYMRSYCLDIDKQRKQPSDVFRSPHHDFKSHDDLLFSFEKFNVV